VSWFLLIIAGMVEVVWAQSIRPTHNLTRLWPTIVCFLLVAVVILLLSWSMQRIPISTAYAVFTGIGAVGAIVLGIIVHRDSPDTGRLTALALICGGVVLARATDPH
jgi:quaternary ammonium compound-resistance protein SugE